MFRAVTLMYFAGAVLAARVEVGQDSIEEADRFARARQGRPGNRPIRSLEVKPKNRKDEDDKAEELDNKEELKGNWNLICNGYIQGEYHGRQGHGSAEEDFIGKDACLLECQKTERCNFITYDEGSGKCWMETIPSVMPSSDCNPITTAWSWWEGDPSLVSDLSELGESHAEAELPAGWHLFCRGYADDNSTWRKGFGAASELHIGKVGCMKACNDVDSCNWVTYDTLSGKCWMEHLKHMPHQCDDNEAGWSYAKNENHQIYEMELEYDGDTDGWHFLCTGYLQSNAKRKYKGRTGLGKADEVNLGHDHCKEACDAKAGCDLVTYDAWTGVCWMENLGQVPREQDCDDNPSGWSYYKGKSAPGKKKQ